MLRFIPSTVRQIDNKVNNIEDLSDIFVLRNELFSIQIELKLERDIWIRLNDDFTIPWEGLTKNYRIELVRSEHLSGKISFEDSVLDDDGIYKKDRILNQTAKNLSEGYHNLWVDLLVTKSGLSEVNINVYSSEGFEDEVLIETATLKLEVADCSQPSNNVFFLDLWQHLSSIARYYNVKLFSNRHFEIIENFLRTLANAGQKVCNLIVSDYSWAGQNCHSILKNKSSLYEYNIIDIKISKNKLILDFSSFDRYLYLCEKLGMAEEINIFGLIGNWQDKKFGSPIKDFPDPIRLRAYDIDSDKYVFISEFKYVKQYILEILEHLRKLDIVHKTKIMADQPKTAESISELENFILSFNDSIKFKYAIKDDGFFENYTGETESFSIILYQFLAERSNNNFYKNISNMTWYVCWKPSNLNQFIKSPLIESRLVGYYTYLFGFKGFLRWNYCLWTTDPNADIRYRGDRWPAGDMFFVYPGKDGYPEESLRFKQLTYGIQDFNFFKYCEQKLSREVVLNTIKKVTGDIEKLEYNHYTTELIVNYTDNYSIINFIKKELVLLLNKERL